MNIFYLDSDIQKCAEYHVDKHVVKMPLELSQLLCTAHWVFGNKAPYKKTHQNHPSAKWTRISKENYLYLVSLGLALCKEYTFRYDKIHGCQQVLEWCGVHIPTLPKATFSPPTPAMNDEYKIYTGGKIDSLLSYRNYYKHGKTHLYSWKRRNKPTWLV